MHGLGVGGARQERPARGEREREDAGCPLEPPPELVELAPVPGVEHSDDGALEAGRGDPGVCPRELERGQLALVSGDDNTTRQGLSIEHLRRGEGINFKVLSEKSLGDFDILTWSCPVCEWPG